MGPLMASLRPLPQRTQSAPPSSTAPLQSNVEQEGYMQKEGGGYRSWRKRYFVLKDGKREKKGEIVMGDVRAVEPSVKARVPHCMDVVTPKRTYKIGCINESDKQDWLKALQSWLKR